MTDHTKRIVESPLFDNMDGLDVFVDGIPGTIVGIDSGHVFVSYVDGDTCQSALNDWGVVGLNFGSHATGALLIYMLSKHCAWAKLKGQEIVIGFIEYGEGFGLPTQDLDMKTLKAPTLAETFARAFEFVEGLA